MRYQNGKEKLWSWFMDVLVHLRLKLKTNPWRRRRTRRWSHHRSNRTPCYWHSFANQSHRSLVRNRQSDWALNQEASAGIFHWSSEPKTCGDLESSLDYCWRPNARSWLCESKYTRVVRDENVAAQKSGGDEKHPRGDTGSVETGGRQFQE